MLSLLPVLPVLCSDPYPFSTAQSLLLAFPVKISDLYKATGLCYGQTMALQVHFQEFFTEKDHMGRLRKGIGVNADNEAEAKLQQEAIIAHYGAPPLDYDKFM